VKSKLNKKNQRFEQIIKQTVNNAAKVTDSAHKHQFQNLLSQWKNV